MTVYQILIQKSQLDDSLGACDAVTAEMHRRLEEAKLLYGRTPEGEKHFKKVLRKLGREAAEAINAL
jgi:hypothetical protein